MEPGNLPLLQVQVVLLLQNTLHPESVELLVGLGPGGAHRRPLAGIEDAELDAGGVDVPRHLPAEGIDLLDQVPLGQPADGRVARHEGNGIQVDGQKKRAAPHAAAASAASQPAWPRSHHDHVICFCRRRSTFDLIGAIVLLRTPALFRHAAYGSLYHDCKSRLHGHSAPLFHVKQNYFPMQNRENIRSRTSSVVVSPVTSPRE